MPANTPVATTMNLSTNIEVVAGTIVTASTLASFTIPLRIATGHARAIYFGVASDQAITVTLRHTGAGRRIVVDNTATAIVAGTHQAIAYTGAILTECELVVTNASGSTATISASIHAV